MKKWLLSVIAVFFLVAGVAQTASAQSVARTYNEECGGLEGSIHGHYIAPVRSYNGKTLLFVDGGYRIAPGGLAIVETGRYVRPENPTQTLRIFGRAPSQRIVAEYHGESIKRTLYCTGMEVFRVDAVNIVVSLQYGLRAVVLNIEAEQ